MVLYLPKQFIQKCSGYNETIIKKYIVVLKPFHLAHTQEHVVINLICKKDSVEFWAWCLFHAFSI